VKYRASGAEIVTGVGAVNAIDRILAQITLYRCLLDRIPGEFFKFELIHSARRLEVKTDRSRALADRQRPRLRQSDVLGNQFRRKVGL
jgi:hypothetical protein